MATSCPTQQQQSNSFFRLPLSTNPINTNKLPLLTAFSTSLAEEKNSSEYSKTFFHKKAPSKRRICPNLFRYEKCTVNIRYGIDCPYAHSLKEAREENKRQFI